MSATLLAPRAGAAPARRRARPPAAPARPADPRRHLRVVEAPSRAVGRRRRRLLLGSSISVLTILTVVVFHVFLAQGQLALGQLDDRLARAEGRYEQARLEHARLASPSRIVQRAAELGLAPAGRAPVPIATPDPPPATNGSSSTLADYGDVKSTLGDR